MSEIEIIRRIGDAEPEYVEGDGSGERWVRLMDLRAEDCIPGETLRWRDGEREGTLTFGERHPLPNLEFDKFKIQFTDPTP